MVQVVDRLINAGAHRGAEEVRRALAALGVQVLTVDLVDPQEGRAETLAQAYRSMGADARPHAQSLQDALPTLDPSTPMVLAIDNLDAMAQVAQEDRAGAMFVQGVAGGPVTDVAEGSPIVGLRATIVHERPEEAQLTRDLLRTLAKSSPPSSSTTISGVSRLDARMLDHARRATSRGTVADLIEPTRVIEREHPATLHWFNDVIQMALACTVETDPWQRRVQALDLIGGREFAAIALVRLDDLIDVIVVRRGAIVVRVTFVARRPPPPIIAILEPLQLASTNRVAEPTVVALDDGEGTVPSEQPRRRTAEEWADALAVARFTD